MTLLDVMERHGYTLERLAGAIGIAPEALNRKIKGNSFTIGDTQRIIQALKLTTEEVMEVFFPTGRDTSVFVVQRYLVTLDLPVKMFAFVHATLDGARAMLEREARATGAALEWETVGEDWEARFGGERFLITEEPLLN
jgi:transcriptional regulator with XRE-family HTH domain